MRTEPPLEHDAIREVLKRDYGIDAADLEFTPVGFSTICYVTDRYFVKIWPADSFGGRDPARLDVTLELLEILDKEPLGARVPAPIKTTAGASRTTFSGMPMVVSELLPGDHAWDDEGTSDARTDPTMLAQMATIMAAIHAATPAVRHLPIPREMFDERPMAGLPDRAIRAAVGSRWGELHQAIDRYETARIECKRSRSPRVLCHRDFGGYNLLIDSQRGLSVLDWDAPAIAPPEHDLWVFASEETIRPFLKAYWDAGGIPALRRMHFEFALLKRALDDMGARIERLQDQSLSADEASELRAGIDRWGFVRIRTLDDVLAQVELSL